MKTWPLLLNFILLILISRPVHAYDARKCREGLGVGISDVTFVAPALGSLTTSTAQFSSSWGGCSAISQLEERHEFIFANLERIKTDAARGDGGYLVSLANLSGCKSSGSAVAFDQVIHENFKMIFLDKNIDSRIDQMIRDHALLKSSCQFSG